MSEIVEHLKKEKTRLLGLIASIDNLLNEYDKTPSPAPSVAAKPVYIPNAKNYTHGGKKGNSLKDSVKNVVLGFDRFKKGTEVLPILADWYPEKKSNMINFHVQVSGILSDWGKTGKIVKYQFSSSRKDTVWGKPEWLDEIGKPKEGYEPILE